MSDRVEQIHKFVKKKGICRVSDLMSHLDMKRSSVNVLVKKSGLLNSFNCNSMWYMFAEHHSFDDMGFCFIGDIGFFINGRISEAIVALVESSDEGMGSRELDEKLKTKTHCHLPKLFKQGRLTRMAATNRAGNAFWYFSSDGGKAKSQKAQYLAPVDEPKPPQSKEILAEDLPDLVEVLLTLIKNPQYTSKSVYLSLQRRGISIGRDFVEQVFNQYFPGKKNS